MWKQSALWLLLAALYILFPPQSAVAGIERLVMPGPVIEEHARYEMQCERCHQPFKKSSQRQLCLKCHNSLAIDLDRKTGFHGRSPAVANAECKHCHTEHKGRDADIVLLDPETFDHQLTDFKLVDSHLQLACDQCHKPKERIEEKRKPVEQAPAGFFSQASTRCFSCHKEIEPHKTHLGEKCQDCHSTASWRKAFFRHGKTGFRLNAMHKPVACVLCHPNQRWKKIATDCYSCHRIDDAHTGRYGQKCQDCHSDTGPAPDSQRPKTAWKKVSFDHSKTKFVLDGKHQKVACDLCHPQQLYGQKLKNDCLACHQRDDLHKGFYGQKCNDCHNTKGWQSQVFDHQKTKFPLAGKHLKVACSSCHTRPTLSQKTGNGCINCHQLDDTHRNSETKRCGRCHTPAGWRDSAQFDHDLSRFPLLGLHAVVPCESCHQNAEFRQAHMECIDCHAKDDKHKQSLGQDCKACHTPNGWMLWQFDHDSGSKSFKLEGAHRGLECLACHKNPVKKKIKLDRTCAACHRQADIHQGEFGRNCERCHLSESFRKLRISR